MDRYKAVRSDVYSNIVDYETGIVPIREAVDKLNTLTRELAAANARNEVYEWIDKERRYQDEKWGSLEQKQQTIEGYLLVLRKELEEAEMGWMKNLEGRDHVLSEIIQIAAVAVACLEQHGAGKSED